MTTGGRPRLTTHILDTAHGRPATGVRIDLSALDASDRPRFLRSLTTNADGRTDRPLLTADEMTVGRYEIAFHVGAYFRDFGAPVAEPPFLDIVPIRFAIADPAAHHHVPSSSPRGGTPRIGAASPALSGSGPSPFVRESERRS